MSERWKYQIKSGGLWGVFMTFFNVLYEIKEKPFMVQLSNPNFYIRAIGFTLVGIFILGYINWKQIEKQKNSKKN